MRKKKILLITHPSFLPPEDINPQVIDRLNCDWITEFDVSMALKDKGHEVDILGVENDLQALGSKIKEFRPHIVFNLLEEFNGKTLWDQNVVSYLELLGVPYTGCNPRGLVLARDKAIAKKILSYHQILTPKFWTFAHNKRPSIKEDLPYPLIIKCHKEEASLGLANASIVHSKEKALERIQYLHHQFKADVMAEEFIPGRELYCGVYGNVRAKAFPIWELKFAESKNPHEEIYHRQAKWNDQYRQRKGIRTEKASLPQHQEKLIQKTAIKIVKLLNLNGSSRIDFRLNNHGDLYFLEANPNPNLAIDDEFALSASYQGLDYRDLIERCVKMGLAYK